MSKSKLMEDLKLTWYLSKTAPQNKPRRLFVRAISKRYIPGYRKLDKGIAKVHHRMANRVKRVQWAIEESNAMRWVYANKHKPVILFGLLKWVNVYEVTRKYGGPEEGGWWYDQYMPVRTKLVFARKAEEHRKQMAAAYIDAEWGDRFSVLGGLAVTVCVEDFKGQREPLMRPHYE